MKLKDYDFSCNKEGDFRILINQEDHPNLVLHLNKKAGITASNETVASRIIQLTFAHGVTKEQVIEAARDYTEKEIG